MKIAALSIGLIFASVNFASAFAITEVGERTCSTSSEAVFLGAGENWKQYSGRISIESGTVIEKRIRSGSNNPHVVLIKARGYSKDVILKRKEYTEQCRSLLQIILGRNDQRRALNSETVSKQNYYNFYSDNSLGGRDGDILRAFNFNFFDEKDRCVNTAKFIEKHAFDERHIALAQNFIERASDFGTLEAAELSDEVYASSIIPAISENRRNLCAYVKVKSTEQSREIIDISIRELR